MCCGSPLFGTSGGIERRIFVGYDVSFHPISPEEMREWYFTCLLYTSNLWLWGLRDFTILWIAALLSVVALVQLHFFIPAAATLCYGFLTIRMEDTTVLDFIKYAVQMCIRDSL